MANISSFHGKKILITGGLGFVGSNLALALVRAGAEVTIIDNLSPGCGGNIFNVHPVRRSLKIHQIDLCDQEKLLASGIFNRNLDFVFSLAARVSHIDSMQFPLEDLRTNATAELTLLECLRHHSPQARVVHTGTRQVFGRPAYFPVNENHPIQPVDINGIHKYCAEQYHRTYHEAFGLRTTVLRLTNTYGPRQLIRPSTQGVAGNFIGRALRREEIELFGDGEQTRDFNFVSDVVEALLLAVTTDACSGGTYNLAGFNHSVASFLRLLAQEVPISVRSIEFPADHKKIEIGNFAASAEKFAQATGWKPAVDLSQGIGETLRFFRDNAACYL
ncbi:MAG: NAD-dependent epimerase/dehydratase family protein [Bacteriovoracia bacterium]